MTIDFVVLCGAVVGGAIAVMAVVEPTVTSAAEKVDVTWTPPAGDPSPGAPHSEE